MIIDTLWHDIVTICRDHPQLLVFLSLAIGYFVGKIKLFGFSLGSTASVLLAALALGQMDVTITPLIRSIAFTLFIFTIGYKVGPQFFGGLKKEGLQYVILSLFFAVVGLITAIMLGKFFAFNKGTSAGLIAGALTQSSVIGTAEDAIHTLSISAAEQNLLNSDIAIAYAITYIFGVAGLILFYKIVPRILGINVKDEAQKLEAHLTGTLGTTSADTFSWNSRPTIRMYHLTNPETTKKTVRAVQLALQDAIAIEKIKRGTKLIDPTPGTTLQADDILLLVGKTAEMPLAQSVIGPEVTDATLATLPTEMVTIYVSHSQVAGEPLSKVIHTYCNNCFVNRITRQGHSLPLTPKTIIQKGDMLQVVGLQNSVDSCAKLLGVAEHPTQTTDIVMVGLGCFLGTLLGIATLKIGFVSLTLGTGGGVLLLGLFFGWLRSMYPVFGQMPEAAEWILSDLGLNLFIACVGLTAGPRAIHALQTNGASLFFAGIILTLIPHILGLIFGKLVLRLNWILLLGALTGAGTATPSLNVLKDDCDSSAPALGYTVPYAIGNFILTIWGTVIVMIM